MIKLERDGMAMEVRTAVQASAFLKNGYELVPNEDEKSDENVATEDKVIEQETENENVSYKKSDISRMNVADLKALAVSLEIEDAEKTSGEKLKEAIITRLGL